MALKILIISTNIANHRTGGILHNILNHLKLHSLFLCVDKNIWTCNSDLPFSVIISSKWLIRRFLSHFEELYNLHHSPFILLSLITPFSFLSLLHSPFSHYSILLSLITPFSFLSLLHSPCSHYSILLSLITPFSFLSLLHSPFSHFFILLSHSSF